MRYSALVQVLVGRLVVEGPDCHERGLIERRAWDRAEPIR